MTTIPTTMRASNPANALAALRSSVSRALSPTPSATDRTPATPTMTKSIVRAVDMARAHLRTGNPGAYARALAGEHRAANTRQQRAIEAVIAADACERLFTRRPANGCLLAREG